jgi:hypothetical protein
LLLVESLDENEDEGCFSSLLDTLGKVLARRGTGRAAGSFG